MAKKGIRDYCWLIAIPMLFLLSGLATISDYGINWDGPFNYKRGQTYLRYMITGKSDYSDLSPCPELIGSSYITHPELKQKCPSKSGFVRSIYQDNEKDLKAIFAEEWTRHPPLGGFLGAVSNTIFFRWLGVMDDVDSYKLVTIVAATLLVFIVGIWSYEVKGLAVSIVSMSTLALYPFLFAHRQFNFKDPVEALFFVGTVYLFWKGIVSKRKIFIFFSAISCALALETKFNIIFVPFIIVPWLLVRSYWRKDFKKTISFFLPLFVLYPIIVCFVFYSLWPYLWVDTSDHITKLIRYYMDLGVGVRYQDNRYFIFGFNTYPFLTILYTTPITMIILIITGIISASRTFVKEKTTDVFLWLLLFLFPILRITIPNMGSFDGVRQVLEFSAGMALVSGVGFMFIADKIRSFIHIRANQSSIWFIILGLVLFVHPLLVLISTHPYQNQYYNFLIGGLSGAKSKNFPAWDQSFGNMYYQGVRWINSNADTNARMGFQIRLMHNRLPMSKIRPDINIDLTNWSGIERKGEYIIESELYGPLSNTYPVQFELKSLQPVYTTYVDGVPMQYIFKNDQDYVKDAYKGKEIVLAAKVVTQDDTKITLKLPKTEIISKLEASYNLSCDERPNGFVFYRSDKGELVKLYEALGEQYTILPTLQMGGEKGSLFYFIPLVNANEIQIQLFENVCPRGIQSIKIYGLSKP